VASASSALGRNDCFRSAQQDEERDVPTYTGNNSSNTINGSNGDDTIYGLGGNDHLSGRGGNDTIYGGTGNDSIEGNEGNDTLYGEDGNDQMSGGTGNDVMSGGAGNDVMSGDDNNDNMSGGTGNDGISGGNGNDTIAGDDGDDDLSGDSGQDVISGGAGNDQIDGGSGNDILHGNGNDDLMFGGTGADTLTGDDGNDQLDGGDDNDSLSGGAGNDILMGGNGNDTLTGGGGYDLLYGGAGTDTAVYGGSIFEYSFFRLGPLVTVSHNGGAGADGTDLLLSIERLQFSDVTIDLTHNNAPIAQNDSAATNEDAGVYSSGSTSVLDNDFDFEGDTLTVTQAVIAGAYGTLTMHSDGTYSYALNAGAQALAQGQVAQDSFTYTVSDGSLSDTANLVITVTGNNDAPVADADTASTDENASILIDVLANDTDVDNGAVLTVTAASAPAGQGTANVVGNQVEFDPGADFDYLAVGESEVVVVGYDIVDEHGATSSSTIAITVTGTNDGPVANPDTGTTGENAVLLIDVLANDTDVDNGAVLTVTAASAPAGQGTASVVGSQVQFDPGSDFDYLGDGESAVVVIDYTIEDEYGVQSSSTVTITVEGEADVGAVITGTDNGETLTGTPGDDTIAALGGDDTVFGLAGADLIQGGDGFDILYGEAGNDVIEGGNDDDALLGGDGNDQLFGQAGNDALVGENGDDQLSGGDGSDSLSGEAGNDVIAGGNDGDFLSGGDGNDQLFGQAGNDALVGENGDDQLSGGDGGDTLDGGEGDDTLDGGDGDDFLSGGRGSNVLTGGAGIDNIVADSTDGPQTIDGGDGNDTILHYYRYYASTITTGSGSDTIEIAHADLGTAAITVTDFTPGAGGDMFRLSGDDGALLSLLSGWDGSSNPFGSGFLRLQQSGADTLFEWDQDGTAGGANWQTLAVFQNSNAGDFTDANFVPGYDPNGSAPAGETITGTNDGETLIGTVGDDTINALGGEDSVFGLAGADLIYGGDGLDNLNGGDGNDAIEGGNGDDSVSGGDGNDQLFGQAGNDVLFGEDGDDQLSGGDGLDNLNGEAGNDVIAGGSDDDFLSGGEGDDLLSGGSGSDVLTGGVGADIFDFQFASDGPDEITDLVSGTDKIQVSASGFGGGLVAGGAVSLVSGTDPTASNSTGQFLFDTDDGRLLWDADGTGSGGAVLVATLSNIPSLQASDFAVI
jgi:VCBS repeat-containing protein